MAIVLYIQICQIFTVMLIIDGILSISQATEIRMPNTQGIAGHVATSGKPGYSVLGIVYRE